MNIEDRVRRGEKLIDRMLGEERAAETRQAWRGIAPEFEAYVVEFLAGEIWSRPHLDLRTRSLVTIATLTGLGRPLALELNIRFAIRNGATRRDITETLLQIAPYAGFPAVWDALATADRVFRDEESADGGDDSP